MSLGHLHLWSVASWVAIFVLNCLGCDALNLWHHCCLYERHIAFVCQNLVLLCQHHRNCLWTCVLLSYHACRHATNEIKSLTLCYSVGSNESTISTVVLNSDDLIVISEVAQLQGMFLFCLSSQLCTSIECLAFKYRVCAVYKFYRNRSQGESDQEIAL